ncbi:sodium- and chloride-dependent glycine transporter 2-like [Haliotis rufescens]|uniref:sodium- and chloride-dependent glycine transporter 2-like n=1 Tax=Haliotis rufescens TaxID=6454 RepID=UPI00201F37C9|nr:sodium- and chloride-dependent glycine transporter 2-like [Haliotis rufescens]
MPERTSTLPLRDSADPEDMDSPGVRRALWPQDSGWRKAMWTSRLDYILTLVGYTVGLGNLWRFPFVCQRNGGAAFLIPYLLFMMTVAMPLFFLEVIIAQLSRRGPIGAWGLCPLMKGIGISQVIVCGMIVPYYSMVFAWVLYYLYSSFSTVLPWTTCDNSWNTLQCVVHKDAGTNVTALLDTNLTYTETVNDTFRSSAEEFWKRDVLRLSSGLDHIGPLQPHLGGAWLASCLIMFLCVIKGIRSVGKVVYLTALLPYFLLPVLLVRSCMMPGALDGILYFISPDFSQLANSQVWLEALVQVFFSVGPAWGAIITMASHNPPHNNAAWDAFIVTLVGVVTSLLAGVVMFAALGFLAAEVETPISQVISSGPGIGFVVYPEALSLLPVPQLWSVLFFLMLLVLGIDSMFVTMETVVVTLEELFSRFLPDTKCLHGLLAGVYVILVFALGLPLTTSGGMYIYQLLDSHVAAVSLLLIAFLECVVIAWFYGIRRFSVDVEYMLGRQPPVIYKILCCFVTPTLLLIALVVTLITFKSPSYGHYIYPPFSVMIGWFIAVVSIVPIPVTMVIQVAKRKGSLRQRMKLSLAPDSGWEMSTRRIRAEEYDLWLGEKISVLENARFIFIREKPV